MLRYSHAFSCVLSSIFGATISLCLLTIFSKQNSTSTLPKPIFIEVKTLPATRMIQTDLKIKENRSLHQNKSIATPAITNPVGNSGQFVPMEYALKMREMRDRLSRWLNKQTEKLYQLECKTGKMVKMLKTFHISND